MILKVFETEEDLATSLLGISTDIRRENFNKLIEILELNNITVERTTNLKDLSNLESDLPVLMIDNKIISSGFYPRAKELSKFMKIDVQIFETVVEKSDLFNAANSGRIGLCCGVGTDVYLDPYDEEDK